MVWLSEYAFGQSDLQSTTELRQPNTDASRRGHRAFLVRSPDKHAGTVANAASRRRSKSFRK